MTIETAMWFALGFLTAGVLALLVMSSLWRRAVRLTRRRVARELPSEVHGAIADKDLQAARFAVDIRRMELAAAAARRQAADARIDAARAAEARAGETVRADGLFGRVGDLEAKLAETTAALEAAQAEIETLRHLLADGEARIAGLMHEVSAREIEVSTRKTELGASEMQLEAARARVSEQTRRVDELLAEKGRLETSMMQERDRADRLDKRIERLVADLADREEVAARRQRELDRAREAVTVAQQRIAVLSARDDALPQAGTAMLRSLDLIEARNRDLEARLAAAEAAAKSGGFGSVPAAFTGEPSASTGRDGLRGEISELAAEMVHLTERLEGPGSPIDRILAAPEGAGGHRPTLAERVRRLRAEAGRRAASGAEVGR